MNKYICEYCSKKFKKKQHLNNHLTRKNKCYKILQCPKCFKIFNTKQHFEYHLNNQKNCNTDYDYYIETIKNLNNVILNLNNEQKKLENENKELKIVLGNKEKYINNLQLFN